MFCRTGIIAAVWLAIAAGAASAQTVIATADGEISGMRIDVTELKRTSGETVTLKFTLVNESSDSISYYSFLGSADMRAVELIDAAGRTKYHVILDSEGKCLCSAGLSTLGAGETANYWARFPAPPAEVTEVGLVFPHFIPTDAPISN